MQSKEYHFSVQDKSEVSIFFKSKEKQKKKQYTFGLCIHIKKVFIVKTELCKPSSKPEQVNFSLCANALKKARIHLFFSSRVDKAL